MAVGLVLDECCRAAVPVRWLGTSPVNDDHMELASVAVLALAPVDLPHDPYEPDQESGYQEE